VTTKSTAKDVGESLVARPAKDPPHKLKSRTTDVIHKNSNDSEHTISSIDESSQIVAKLGSVAAKYIPNSPVAFRRNFLFTNIGGSDRRTWCVVPGTHPAKNNFPSLSKYVCTRPVFSPYLPTFPSEHGVMYDWNDESEKIPPI